MLNRSAAAIGIATLDADGTPLDAWYPSLALGEAGGDRGTFSASVHELSEAMGEDASRLLAEDPIRGVHRVGVKVAIPDLSLPVEGLHDLFLRLHLLSHRLVRPNSLNLDGMFEVMDPDIAWTSSGPCRASKLGDVMRRAKMAGQPLHVRSLFAVPPMLDYVWPSGVTIADAARVLLGAHLAPGTMVTHEGFCGLNAGSLGPSMIEGRISAGVVIGSGSDVGGGASLMGTISGGGRERVSLGERCLLGANSGVGIALGDDCLVEAGCYITAGALVALPDGSVVKARELSGRPRLIYRRNSRTGSLEALENTGRWGGLNPVLHKT